MAHAFIKTIIIHKTGGAPVLIPNNGSIIGVTTVTNGPALLISMSGPEDPEKTAYIFHVYELDGSNTIVGADDTDYVGTVSTGARAWAVFKYIY